MASSTRWEWRGGGSWMPYSEEQCNALEATLKVGSLRCDLSAEHYVNLRTMQQVRCDDPTKTRGVRRTERSSSPSPKRARTRPDPLLAFRLNELDARWDASARANARSVSLADVLSDLGSASEVHLHNYLVDLDWVFSECPGLRSVPCVRAHASACFFSFFEFQLGATSV